MGSRHGRNPYLFTLKTTSTIYHCGERDDFDENGTLIPANPKCGKGTRIAIAWADDIKSAYQPVSASQNDVLMQPKPPSPEPGDEMTGKPQEPPVDDNSEKVFIVLSINKSFILFVCTVLNVIFIFQRTSVKYTKYFQTKFSDLGNLVLCMGVRKMC